MPAPAAVRRAATARTRAALPPGELCALSLPVSACCAGAGPRRPAACPCCLWPAQKHGVGWWQAGECSIGVCQGCAPAGVSMHVRGSVVMRRVWQAKLTCV